MARLETLLDEAIDLADEGEYEASVAMFDELLKAAPRHPQALHESALALASLGRFEQAIERHEQLMELDPSFPGARAWLARSYAEVRRHADAAACLLVELRAEPDELGVSPSDWDDCARYLVEAGDVAAARALLEEYFAVWESRVTVHARHATAPMRRLAAWWSDAGEHARALQLAKRAFEHPHQQPADIVNWIRVAARAGESAQARRAWDEFRSTPYWDGYREYPEMVAIYDELERLVG